MACVAVLVAVWGTQALFGATGPSAPENELAGRMPRLGEAVDALPESSSPQRLKKAMLAWALEDARADLQAGLVKAAKATIADVQALLGRDVGGYRRPPERIVPTIPHQAKNPYWPVLKAVIAEAVLKERRYPKGEEGYRRFGSSSAIRATFSGLVLKAWGLCAPQSPAHQDPALLRQVLRDFEAVFRLHRNGDFDAGRRDPDRNMNRFTFASVNDAYLMFRSAFPDLVPPSMKARWERAVRQGAEFQVKTFGTFARYPNIDLTWALMMHLAGEVLDEPRYRKMAAERVAAVRGVVFPDGALPYSRFGNESINYHGVDLIQAGRYRQLTASEEALALIRATAPYYPLVAEANLGVNSAPAPYYKTYWSFHLHPCDVQVAADVAGDPANRQMVREALASLPAGVRPDRLYRNGISVSLLLAASVYGGDAAGAGRPDRLLVYDRNIEGPRGRFGGWGFVANGRDQRNDPMKLTFVGCTAVAPPRPGAVGGALQIVQCHTPAGGVLLKDDRCATTVGADFAAFSVRHHAENGEAWTGTQQWIMTPQRMVGAVALRAASADQAGALRGWLRIGGCGIGAEGSTPAKFEVAGANAFRFGALCVRIVGGSLTMARCEKAKGHRAGGGACDVFLEADGGAAAAGGGPHSGCFVVEARPAAVRPARLAQRRVTPGGIEVLEMAAEEGRFVLVHNPTEGPQEYTHPDLGLLHRSGPQPGPTFHAGRPIRLAPFEHVVIRPAAAARGAGTGAPKQE